MDELKRKLLPLLDEKYQQFSKKEFFLETDPIQIPHRFTKKEDIEIAGFIAATLAWGQRKTIINNAGKWMNLMDDSPYDFIMNHQAEDLKCFKGFVHRTFNESDCLGFIHALQNLYLHHNGLEGAFSGVKTDFAQGISDFKKIFFSSHHLSRTTKHVADPISGSSAKRICMYLRWMCRPANTGTDLGIWTSISPAELYLPLDVHSGNVARHLGLLTRTQNDWKAVSELTLKLREFDHADPCKYDYALFGIGAFDDYQQIKIS